MTVMINVVDDPLNQQLLLRAAAAFLVVVVLFVLIHGMMNNSMRKVMYESRWISVKTFFRLRNQRDKDNKLKNEKYNVEGVYIIYNRSQKRYYVGQAHKLLSRVNNHFTAKGNGEVYADYKYHDRFRLKLIPLKGSGFKTLNELESYYIARYKAMKEGYNKTRGNRF